jgi:putative Mg2+ transporter-C (MgtC) family protein
LLSIYGFSEFIHEENVRVDPARLAAQVISGIGFLGAGAILRNGLSISGLTTAASIWVVAAIGLSVGAGFYYGSILCTVLVFMVLQLLNRLEKRMRRSRTEFELILHVFNHPHILGKVANVLEVQGIQIKNVRMKQSDMVYKEEEGRISQWVLQLKVGSSEKVMVAMDRLHAIEDVVSIEMKNPSHHHLPLANKNTVQSSEPV